MSVLPAGFPESSPPSFCPRRFAIVASLYLLHKLLDRDLGLLKDSAKGTDSRFTVERHDASEGSLSYLLPENPVTPTLPNLSEP
jgi:hypothetical protein